MAPNDKLAYASRGCARVTNPLPACLPASRYAKECQTKEQGFGLDRVLRQQAWKLRGGPAAQAQQKPQRGLRIAVP